MSEKMGCPLKLVFLIGLLLGALNSNVWAWSNHNKVTRLALQAYEWPEKTEYEIFENTLSDLKGVDGRIYSTRAEFEKAIQIQGEKIQWNWKPQSESPIDVIAYSVDETDQGMDQNLNLSPDQKFMGGFTGPSSQGHRHMYYGPWSVTSPLATFHYPFHEMGEAPSRAALFFALSKQLKKTGHTFWAYRFLGWGLHYVQDVTQPYHSNQLGSLRLVAWKKLFSSGAEGLIAETTRIVANFHIAFEEYTLYLLDPERASFLGNAFKIPKGDELLRLSLEQKSDLSIEDGVKLLARYSGAHAPSVVSFENEIIGDRLHAPLLNLMDGFYDAAGMPKIDFRTVESDSKFEESRNGLRHEMFDTLSNAGVATRWYLDRFKQNEE